MDPARRRTLPAISIHALREEGDRVGYSVTGTTADFYPRPPRGGRQWDRLRALTGRYFYPRPPRGGRPCISLLGELLLGFLSTPSARRATREAEAAEALRKENFYPRPPRGGRPLKVS